MCSAEAVTYFVPSKESFHWAAGVEKTKTSRTTYAYSALQIYL